MLDLFKACIAKMKARIRGVARASKNEFSVEDLEQDAWILALELGDRRGYALDFSGQHDQEILMSALYTETVRRGDWQFRNSVRIDQDREEEEGGVKWSEKIAAQPAYDPLVEILMRESATDYDALLSASYSQATHMQSPWTISSTTAPSCAATSCFPMMRY